MDPLTTPLAASAGVSLLAESNASASCGADATEDTLATITVPANALGPNGTLRITTFWTFSGAGGTRTIRVRFNGAGGSQYLNFATGSARTNAVVVTYISNLNATNSQGGQSMGVQDSGGGVGNVNATSAADTTGATTAVITGQKGSAGDVCTLVGFIAEVVRP